MDSLKKDHSSWLVNYNKSEDFDCAQASESCETYHVLSPILHDKGITHSYKKYELLIINILSDMFYNSSPLNIIVVGIDSEESAKELIHSLQIFKGKFRLLFIDSCATPLNRINRCLDEHEKHYLSTKKINIFERSAESCFSQFDIVFADSFLKQFKRKQKVEALRQIAKFLKKPGGIIIIREYFGVMDQILNAFWAKIDFLLKTIEPKFFSSNEEVKQFQILLQKLRKYYKQGGRFYPEPEKLIADLKTCKLTILNEYETNRSFDRVFVLKNYPE